jgi:arylsulfatase A-like enzyme
MEVYAAQVDRMDQNIGKIVKALNDTGEMDNTLLLFLSDNGGCAENMGRDVHEDRAKASATQPMRPDELEPDVFPKFTRQGKPIRDGYIAMPGPAESFVAYGQGWANVSNTPFKEYKHWVHEGGISTPLIAHWPAGISRHGVIETQPGHVVDLLATAADVGKATHEKPIDGVSLVPAFAGKPLDRPRPIFWEHEGNRAVREGKWKLVATGAAGPWELYDMDADRTEMHDLAGEHADRVKTMSQAWEAWAASNKVLPLQDFEKKPATQRGRG